MSMYTVGAVVVVDSEGERIASRYYGPGQPDSLQGQRDFEDSLVKKTAGLNHDIIMLDKVIAVYRHTSDVSFYVIGGHEENELILATVLGTIHEALALLLRNQIDKRTLLENYDYLLLVIDEALDGGVILESDPQLIAQRVAMRNTDEEVPLAEQTLSEVLGRVRETVVKNLK